MPQDEKEEGAVRKILRHGLWHFVFSPLRINPQVTPFQTSGRSGIGRRPSDSQPWAPSAAATSVRSMKEKQVGEESGMNIAQLCGVTSGKSLYRVGPQPLTLPSEAAR